MRTPLLFSVLLSTVVSTVLWSSPSLGRAPEECQLAWGQAVRSYLTQNRLKGPEDEAFVAACALETQGKKADARIEAVFIGVRALSKLDPRGCQRFLEAYVGSKKPAEICKTAVLGQNEDLRRMIADSLPEPPERRAPRAKEKE